MAAVGDSKPEANQATTSDIDLRPHCKYGINCYRKNPDHLRQYQHPKRNRPAAANQNDEAEEGCAPEKRQKNEVETGESQESKNDSETMETTLEEEEEEESSDKEKETRDLKENQPEELIPPPSPEDIKENIKQKFLVEMPEDFYELWEFCKSNKPKDPSSCFSDILGFNLVGPFDILAGKQKKLNGKNSKGHLPNYLLHWRYYFDPPEFQTVIRGDDQTQFHLGYYRDDPLELPVFVASTSAKESCLIKPCGENLFAAINWYLADRLKSKKLSTKERKAISELQKKLIHWSEERNICLKMQTAGMTARNKKVVCKTFHGAGIVVKLDQNKVGYRPVPESAATLRKMFTKICSSRTESERDKNFEALEELLTLVQFANDECDYGEGLELGLALFCHGGNALHSAIQHLMPLAYQLLQRPQFSQIITAHLKQRNLDIPPKSLNELD